MTTLSDFGPTPHRFRRYATLRSVQRALSPIRSLPDRLPGEEILKEVRKRLQDLTRGTDATHEDHEEITRREREVERMLEAVEEEFLSILEGVSFSELRAALPRARTARPNDVRALLDLCLEPDDPSPRQLSVIDYLTTLLATEFTETGGKLVVDPVGVTPTLRRRCERFTDYDVEEVQTYVAAFDAAITELSRVDMIDEVMSQARELKTRLGRLRFAPQLLRKIVDYNISATNRLEDTIEAERLLHELEVETATCPKRDPLDPKAIPESTDASAQEDRERDAIATLARAIALRLEGFLSSGDDAAQLVDAIDLTILSGLERAAFAADDDTPSKEELVRSVVVVGSLLRTAETVPTLLTRVGLPLDRLRERWVPGLDARVQATIAGSLREGADREAKQLSQTRAKFLYRVLEPPGPAGPTGPPEGSRSPNLSGVLELGLGRKFAPFAPSYRLLRRTGSPQLRRRVAPITLVLAAIIGIGLYVSSGKDPRSVRVLDAESTAKLSPYLDSAYRDGLGNGPTFVGTVTAAWWPLSTELQRKEIAAIGTKLRWTGVREIMLFDEQRRLRARWVRGTVRHPPVPSALAAGQARLRARHTYGVPPVLLEATRADTK